MSQDVIFGSEGTAQADFERMEEINREIGLTQMLRGADDVGSEAEKEKEKRQVSQEHKETAI